MTAKILHGGEIVQDAWTVLEDGCAEIESSVGRVIVTLARWRTEREALLARYAAVGVLVPNTTDIEAAHLEISDRPLIALQFPTFTDGRALSQAVVLRKRLAFRGELRALGDVIRDLVFWLGRCGFDSIVPRKDQNLESCRAALNEITVAYQAAADHHTPVWIRRRGQAAAH
ncbi:MAG: DUF934 domain-containing protein [Gammaproteobacteria bacterium]|nr:DUF934 domain-containing protein [Gammaproteobacteria bacterium]MDE2261955.1 DUF934 domain-containing protein [Gammaproteobacteria bacterium]